jgi:hypothetical protein
MSQVDALITDLDSNDADLDDFRKSNIQIVIFSDGFVLIQFTY